MIPTSAAFETNRQALSNVATYKAYLSLLNLAYAKGVVPSSEYGAKYPITAVVNGNNTHKNYGLDVGDPGYDELFPAKNVWQSAVEVNPYFYVDLGDYYLINKIQIIGHPLYLDFSKFNIQYGLAGSDWTVRTAYLKAQGFNYKNDPVPVVSVNAGTGEITTNATMNELWFSSEVWARYVKFYCTVRVNPSIRVCQFFVGRVVDVSADVVDMTLQDSMTYNLKRRMAKAADLTLRNYDKKYTPTV